MKRTTIFSQLVINIIIPVVLSLTALAFFNYISTKSILQNSNKNKNSIISNEIKNILQFQDFSLDIIEAGIEARMYDLTYKLVFNYLSDTDEIEKIDLNAIHQEIGMISGVEDIYVINKQGVVVNTTFKKDMRLNFFHFGEKYKNYLLGIFEDKKFHIDRFTIEAKTKKLKKYSYHATPDGKYIIELGFYSEKANKVMDQVKEQLNGMASKHESISKIDLFYGEQNPVSFNNADRKIMDSHLDEYKKTLKNKLPVEFDLDINGEKLHYEFIYMPRKNSELYSEGIIRVISDRTADEKLLRDKLILFVVIFGATILFLFILILNKSKSISNPIMRLAQSVTNISHGDLSARTEVIGNNEITTLSEQFNIMLERLQKSYDELEQKVIERTAEIYSQKEKIETQNHQITDSIRYAKRIQTAILPSDELLDQTIKEHFVLFKPRDIVSGDFYWTGEKNGKSVIIAADCTGHGVPGAFMSMIGNTLLNQIINEKAITKPSDILWHLRKEIINLLAQKGSKVVTKSKDGMDVAICTIDYTNKKLEFAGANNPMFFIRNNELQVIKGSRQPVGTHMLEDEPFENHEMELQNGDRWYIASDGYQDQYGGELERKFMVGNLKRFLVEIHKKPMYSQKEIMNNTIEEWMANTRQIDDILVIGMKI